MRINTKYYPYPVIIEGNESYLSAKIESDVDAIVENYDIKFSLKISVNNEEVNDLIRNKKAAFIHHIECAQTCYRRVVSTNKNEDLFIEHRSKLSGLVQVCSMIVAIEDIDNYKNTDFSADYRGFSFKIKKGCVLGIGNQIEIFINKDKEALENTSSIFSIVPLVGEEDRILTVTTNQKSKIIIGIPQKSYYIYKNLSINLELQSIMHSMIIVPALMEVFDTLKSEELYNFEDYRWFKALKKICMKFNINLEEDIDQINNFDLAQKMLDSPVVRAIEFLASGEGADEE